MPDSGQSVLATAATMGSIFQRIDTWQHSQMTLLVGSSKQFMSTIDELLFYGVIKHFLVNTSIYLCM